MEPLQSERAYLGGPEYMLLEIQANGAQNLNLSKKVQLKMRSSHIENCDTNFVST